MASEIDRSLFQLALAASRHSQRYLRSQYALGNLSHEQAVNIGTDLVRLFEERYEEEVEKSTLVNPNASPTPLGGERKRQRLRGHIESLPNE